ncbi:putative glyoxalase superfamily protein PhnB [Arthrobacter silviterrae]|uniref:Glyoxalase n=1 Tax=Arthrobacter silviterrae TaxID=2026658 RepID=A0ABX0D5S6_9MICC|nr:VOC family protein [Arthrobacter silviterrae]MDQ0279432.1 putative glyoxalase superfamily protein PhnB [Arthrobacter silviterrae]NGN82088.1 glyoxalase [Arthrobacter silviterrae]
METDGVVLSRVVADAARSLAFYRDGLGMADARLMLGLVCLELPGLTLFLAQPEDFARNTGLVPGSAAGRSDGVLSCAIGSTGEVDRLLETARSAGGTVVEPQLVDHASGRRQYIGTVTDPDGYVWQLVCNVPAGGQP